MADLPDTSIDLVVTSPPYDNLRVYGGHTWDFPGVASHLTRLLNPGGVIVWIVADATVNGSETGTSMRQALHFKDVCGLNLHDTMIYEKLNYLPQNSGDRYDQVWDFCFIFSTSRPKTFNGLRKKSAKSGESLWSGGRINANGILHDKKFLTVKSSSLKGNMWKYATGGGNRNHPAKFPDNLARDHILSWSNPGDVVLDPFLGSGTTLKMAKETGRRGIGIEINPEYIPIAVNRLAQEVLFGIPAKSP